MIQSSIHKPACALHFALCIALFMTLSCGSDQPKPGYSGIAFSLEWERPSVNAAAGVHYAAPIGVSVIRMSVSAMDMMTMSQTFPVAAGSGSILNVPAGINRTITFDGLDASNVIVYRAAVSNVMLVVGQTYNCGTVTMSPVGTTIPNPPTGVVATAGNLQNSISWNSSANATGYNLYWSTDSSVNKSSAKISLVSSPYTHGPLSNGIRIYYVVTAVNGTSESAESLTVNATPTTSSDIVPPSVPTGLAATAVSSSQIDLSWTASTDNVGVTGYKIFRGNPVLTFLKSSSTTTASDTGLAPSTNYCYTVSALDAANNESGQSVQMCATTQTTTLEAPGGVIATADDAQTHISWNIVSGATSYNIYWSLTSGVTRTNSDGLMPSATSPYTHTSLENGRTYYYVVYAVSLATEGPKSLEVSATPSVPGAWVSKAAMPAARYANAIVSLSGKLYAVGGTNSPCGVYSTLEEYDPASNTWTARASMPTARNALGAAVVNDILYAVGGGTGCPSPNYGLATVEAYNRLTNTWTTKTSMPTARHHFGLAVANGIIYAIGGDSNGPLATVEAYDPGTDTWTTKTSMPTARSTFAIGVVNNIIYVAGGSAAPYNQVEAYDPVANTWTTKASLLMPRGYLGGAVVSNKFYAIGGNSGGALATVEAYDPTVNTWATKPSMSTMRDSPAVGVVNDMTIYAVGGSTGAVNPVATVEAYTP